MKRDQKIYLRLQGAQDARDGKSIDAFYDETFVNRAGSRKAEGARAEYEIGYRAAKEEMRRESVHFYQGPGNAICQRCGNTLNHPIHGGRQREPKVVTVMITQPRADMGERATLEFAAIAMQLMGIEERRTKRP